MKQLNEIFKHLCSVLQPHSAFSSSSVSSYDIMKLILLTCQIRSEVTDMASTAKVIIYLGAKM